MGYSAGKKKKDEHTMLNNNRFKTKNFSESSTHTRSSTYKNVFLFLVLHYHPVQGQSPPVRACPIMTLDLRKVDATLAAVNPADPPPIITTSYDFVVLEVVLVVVVVVVVVADDDEEEAKA